MDAQTPCERHQLGGIHSYPMKVTELTTEQRTMTLGELLDLLKGKPVQTRIQFPKQ